MSRAETTTATRPETATAPLVLDARLMQQHAATAARLMRSLANPHRLLVLCVLSEGELSVSELNQRIPLSQSALSQHLAVLRREKLVRTRRESQTIYYAVADGAAMDIVHLLHDKYCCTPPRNVARPANSKATRRGNRNP